MSIKIEVTGDSLTEVADKLLAIGNSLRGTASYQADDAAREALQASRKGKTPPKKEPPAAVGEASSSTTIGATGSESQADVSPPASQEQSQTETASTSSFAQAEKEPAASAGPKALDFDKDVAPVVIGFVQSKGKPFVVGILEQFGVTKASELPEDRWGELLAALEG